ncbi:MAG: hypothetical protein AB7T19_05095 [Planctomycetota bacterium]
MLEGALDKLLVVLKCTPANYVSEIKKCWADAVVEERVTSVLDAADAYMEPCLFDTLPGACAEAGWEWWGFDSDEAGQTTLDSVMDVIKKLEQDMIDYPDFASSLRGSLDALWGLVEGR